MLAIHTLENRHAVRRRRLETGFQMHSEVVRLAPMLARMAPVSPATAYAEGDTIYTQEGAAQFIYEVIEGMVRTARLGTDGRRIVHGFFVPGDIFGIEPNGVHACSAETVCPTRI